MHDIWNPWHGCIKCSEGCEHCYMYFLDRLRDQDGANIYKTKSGCLPSDWGDGWDNIFFNVTCENQRRADERIPILLNLPFKHKGIMCAPLIGPVSIHSYLKTGQIERVKCGGENYDGSRPCDFDWVKALRQECFDNGVTFCFIETGNAFYQGWKDLLYAGQTGAEYDDWGLSIPDEERYVPHFHLRCQTCGSKLICNGCSDCGKCER